VTPHAVDVWVSPNPARPYLAICQDCPWEDLTETRRTAVEAGHQHTHLMRGDAA
jgi:hypothetical protein